MTDIILKQGTGVPSDTDVEVAEVALDTSSGAMYTKLADGSVKHLNPVSTGGGGGGESLWEQNGDDIYYNDGNVGIGKTPNWNPTTGRRSLEVYGDGSSVLSMTTQNTGDFVLYAGDDGNVSVRNEANGNMTFATDNENRLTIDAEGRVGIGTTSPAKTLDVTGTSRVTGEATFGNDVVLTNSAYVYSNAGGSGVRAGWQLDGTNQIIKGLTGGTERMQIDSSGNVGIGTSSPASVVTSASTCLHIDGGASQSASALFRTTNAQWEIGSWENSSANFGIFNNATTSFAFSIDTAGNVGIGGEPGTLAIDEAKALAKTKLAAWKAEVKKRTAEQPEASTQEITLEVTDGDFGVMPTEEALAEFLQGRAIGGGSAKLQVAGDGYFSGSVNTDGGVYGRRASGNLLLKMIGYVPGTDDVEIVTSQLFKVNNTGGDTYFTVNTNNGNVHAKGDVVAYSTTVSDAQLKDNVETIDNALDKVCALRGVSYTWNQGSREGQEDIGVIAQEVETVFPQIVREHDMPMLDGETYKTVDYEKLCGVLIEAVKELKSEVEALKRG